MREKKSKGYGGGFVPRKHWGQHFLVDSHIVQKILRACDLKPYDKVLEIGPGSGVLTKEIARRVEQVIAIEKDPILCSRLRGDLSTPNTTIIEADFLKYDFERLPKPLKVIGNLPYYISTPILVRLLEHHENFTEGFFTLQWEFGKRLVAGISTKDYSALSCLVQFYAEPEFLFKIKKTCFRPVPKIDSCFMKLQFLPDCRFEVKDRTFFFNLIREAFQQRRKKILNSLCGSAAKETIQDVLASLKISTEKRAGDLTLKNYADIANALLQKLNNQ